MAEKLEALQFDIPKPMTNIKSKVITRAYGVCVPIDDRVKTVCDLLCKHLLNRGNERVKAKMSTNESYIRRQLRFLEWFELEDQKYLRSYYNGEEQLLVTEEAVRSFLEEVRADIEGEEKIEKKGKVDLETVEENLSSVLEATEDGPLHRRGKPQRVTFGRADIRSFCNALTELQNWQHEMLNLQDAKALKESTLFKAFKIEAMNAAVQRRLEAAFGEMGSGAMRADNQHIITYSDKFHMKIDEYVPETPLGDLFICVARQSKENKNGNKDYYVKLCAMDPLECPVLIEAIMLCARHDLLNVPLPNFDEVEVDEDGKKFGRPWYNDFFYPNLNARSAVVGSSGGSGGQGALKKPYTIDQMSKNWSRDFGHAGIMDSLHVLHLQRGLSMFKLSMKGISREDKLAVGKYKKGEDDLQLSYDHIPQLNVLASIAGSRDMKGYKPLWTMIQPPKSLTSLVLSAFQVLYPKLRERYERASKAKSQQNLNEETKFQLEQLMDSSAVHFCEYATKLSVVLVQGCVFLKDSRQQHFFFKKHALFHHEHYQLWSAIAKNFRATMEALDRKYNVPHETVASLKLHCMFDKGVEVELTGLSESDPFFGPAKYLATTLTALGGSLSPNPSLDQVLVRAPPVAVATTAPSNATAMPRAMPQAMPQRLGAIAPSNAQWLCTEEGKDREGQMGFFKDWVDVHQQAAEEDLQMPVILEEFGGKVGDNKRYDIFKEAFDGQYVSQQRGGSFGGVLFWILYHSHYFPLDKFGGGYGQYLPAPSEQYEEVEMMLRSHSARTKELNAEQIDSFVCLFEPPVPSGKGCHSLDVSMHVGGMPWVCLPGESGDVGFCSKKTQAEDLYQNPPTEWKGTFSGLDAPFNTIEVVVLGDIKNSGKAPVNLKGGWIVIPFSRGVHTKIEGEWTRIEDPNERFVLHCWTVAQYASGVEWSQNGNLCGDGVELSFTEHAWPEGTKSDRGLKIEFTKSVILQPGDSIHGHGGEGNIMINISDNKCQDSEREECEEHLDVSTAALAQLLPALQQLVANQAQPGASSAAVDEGPSADAADPAEREFDQILNRVWGNRVATLSEAVISNAEEVPKSPKNPCPRPSEQTRFGTWFDTADSKLGQLINAKLGAKAGAIEFGSWAPVFSYLIDITAGLSAIAHRQGGVTKDLLVPYIGALGRVLELASSLLEVHKLQAQYASSEFAVIHKLAREKIRGQGAEDSFSSTLIAEVVQNVTDKSVIALTKTAAQQFATSAKADSTGPHHGAKTKPKFKKGSKPSTAPTQPVPRPPSQDA
ncbi:hypothetical protein BSKO_13673 [Bryopsis sp. KO-2023]|nr:hypothetical protein BSKO_13673 [Bryopsis sp. KO-2023]